MVRTVLLSLAFLLAAGPLEAERYKGFPRGHALIGAAELNSLLRGPGPGPAVLAAVGSAPGCSGTFRARATPLAAPTPTGAA